MATNDDMRERLERVERKVDQFDKKLDLLPTKADLAGFATKPDLERFATKADLEPFATKEDFAGFATKADLTAFAEEIKNHVGLRLDDAKEWVQKAAEGYGATLERIERDLDELNAKMDTGFFDHGKLLKDHDCRITALEGR